MLRKIKEENQLIEVMHKPEKKVILLMARWSPLAVTIQKLLDFHSKKYPKCKFYYVDIDDFDRPKRFFDFSVIPVIKCVDSDGDLVSQKATTSKEKILDLIKDLDDDGFQDTTQKIDLRRFSKNPNDIQEFINSRERGDTQLDEIEEEVSQSPRQKWVRTEQERSSGDMHLVPEEQEEEEEEHSDEENDVMMDSDSESEHPKQAEVKRVPSRPDLPLRGTLKGRKKRRRYRLNDDFQDEEFKPKRGTRKNRNSDEIGSEINFFDLEMEKYNPLDSKMKKKETPSNQETNKPVIKKRRKSRGKTIGVPWESDKTQFNIKQAEFIDPIKGKNDPIKIPRKSQGTKKRNSKYLNFF